MRYSIIKAYTIKLVYGNKQGIKKENGQRLCVHLAVVFYLAWNNISILASFFCMKVNVW